MNKQVLNKDQEQLLSLIQLFSSDFYLVGGTAIALHLGHRRSIDYDLFTDNNFDPMKLRNRIMKDKAIDYTFSQGSGELTVLINKVKVTFFYYPFIIQRNISFEQTLKLPDLITLGAMKAFALGRRQNGRIMLIYILFFKNIHSRNL